LVQTWVESFGLTIVQLIGFFLTVAASFFAARFGASESRRQHKQKLRLEMLTAAGELIQHLYNFANRLESIYYGISNDRSSKGHTGNPHSSLSLAILPENVFQLAATIGESVLADLIKLAGARQLAGESISMSFEYVDEDDAVTETQAWSAHLIILTFDLINQIATRGHVPLTFHPSINKEELEKRAGDRISDITLDLLPRRVGRSAAVKSARSMPSFRV
jgi:hypothetical protein